MTIRIAIATLSVVLVAGPVWAEECPDYVPEDQAQRRVQAKYWFAQGEAEGKGNDNVAALKAYQCSLKFVPHGFTAFNIAQIAERVGDLELAITSYNQYLLLAPDAKDGQEVNEKVEALKIRLAKARESAKPREPVRVRPRERETADTGIQPTRTATGTPAGGSRITVESGVQPAEASKDKYRMAAWISYGSGGVLLATGIITNLIARGKMDTCRSKYSNNDKSGAESACSDAKPLAYLSYGAFGLGAAAVAAGTILLFLPGDSGDVSVNMLPGGMALQWGGRF
jgi:tetratricopeptide (TPR) repeat protein